MTRVISSHPFFSQRSFSQQESTFSRGQLQHESLAQGFSDELGHWQSLVAMSLGGLTYRLGNAALLSSSLRFSTPGSFILRNFIAPTLSLGAEVAIYESSERTLLALSGDRQNPNLFRWSDTGGIWEGLRNSYINFGFLKLGGHFHTQNIFLQHLTQDILMTAGHEATAQLGWVPHENGSLLERLVHAEVKNIQLGSAMSLLHGLLPSLRSVERNVSRESERTTAPQESHEDAESHLPIPRFSSSELKDGETHERLPLSEAERTLRLNAFLENGADRIAHALESHRDRGLIVSPVGTREVLDVFLERQLNLAPAHRNMRRLRSSSILIVAHGLDNVARLRTRMNRVFSVDEDLNFFSDRTTWRKNGLHVHIVSVHSLAALKRNLLERFLTKYGMVVLDKEHHVRMVDDRESIEAEALPLTERNRLGKILLAGGWMEEMTPGNFQRRANPNTFLLGLTESVSEGAGLIYGPREGCLFASNLAEMEASGIIARPRLNLVIPESIQDAEPRSIRDRWRALSLQDRVLHIKGLIDVWVAQQRELGDPTLPRILINAGSRDEADLLTQVLEADPRYADTIALMTSYQSRREVDRNSFLNLRIKKIGIHIETLTEGVDEFNTDPLDYVILAGSERAGGLRYALQTTGGHLNNSRPPELVDVCGMTPLHPEMAFFDPSVFILSEGEVRRGSLRQTSNIPGPEGINPLRATQIYDVDIFAENVAETLGSLLREFFPTQDPLYLAQILNLPRDWVTNLWSGSVLPTRFALQNLLEQLDLNQTQQQRVWESLAHDRSIHYNFIYPIAALRGLSPTQLQLLAQARRGFFQFYDHFDAVDGITPETLQRYLENGTVPDRLHNRASFLAALARVVFGPNRADEGMRLVTEVFGLASTRDFWMPETSQNLSDINRQRIEAWFTVIYGSEERNDSQEIALEFRRDPPNRISGFKILNMDETQSDEDCRIQIQRRGEGYRVVRVRGNGSVDAVARLRTSTLAQDGLLGFRSESWLFYEIARQSGSLFEMTEIRNVEARDLNAWFEYLSQAAGRPIREMVLEFIPHDKDFLTSLRPVLPQNREQAHKYGKIWIERSGDRYRITRMKGAGCERVLELLRESELATEGILTFRPLSWMHHAIEWGSSQLFDERDLEFIEVEDIERWFEYASRGLESPVEELRLAFFRKKDGQLSSLKPLGIGESELSNSHGWIRISRNGPGKYRVTEAKQSGSLNVSNILRRSNLAKEGILDVRPVSWLRLELETNSHAFNTADLKWIEVTDLDRFFAFVSRGKAEAVQRIVIKYKISKSGLTAFAPVGEEFFYDDETSYTRILIEKTGPQKYRIIGARMNCDSVLEVLRSSFIALAGNLEIRPDSWLYYSPDRQSRQFRRQDLRFTETRDLENWFESVRRRSGIVPDKIVLQFSRSTPDLFSGLTPFSIDELPTETHFSRVFMERSPGGNFRITGIYRKAAEAFIEQLRECGPYQNGLLTIDIAA